MLANPTIHRQTPREFKPSPTKADPSGMKRLRVVKERAPETQSSDFDQDLRGLGNDPILKEAYPYAVLSVRGASTKDPLVPFLRRFELEGLSIPESPELHLCARDRKEGLHKEHAVLLYIAALEFVSKLPGSAARLDFYNPLHERILQETRGSEHGIETSFLNKLAAWDAKGGITLASGVTIALEQAGFDLPASPHQDLHLSSTEVVAALSHLRAQVAPQVRLRKAG